MKILHNPRCRKSRETLALLEENQTDLEVILYLKDVPSKEELSAIIKKLKISPFELIRKSESIYKEQFKGQSFSDDEWIDIMLQNPKLIERPIVISDDRAVIGRPPNKVLELL